MKRTHIQDDRRIINIKLTQEEYDRFRKLADEEDRSMVNFASVLVRRYIREAWDKKTPDKK